MASQYAALRGERRMAKHEGGVRMGVYIKGCANLPPSAKQTLNR